MKSEDKKPLILIVEDREDDVILLERRLKKSYRVEVANDGETALKKCGEIDPDLMMIDIQLPDANGVDLLAKVRKSNPDTAVMIMTAYGSEEIARKAMRMGAGDYVIKPVELKGIADRVRKVLEKQRLENEKGDLEKKLRRERDYLRTIVKCSADAIIMTDPLGMITLFSPGAEELFKVRKSEVIGESLSGYLARGRSEMSRIIKETLGAGTIHHRAVDFLRRGGSQIIPSLSGSALNNEDANGNIALFGSKD